MQFRLTYAGPLYSSGNDSKERKAVHKHEIRQALSPQLERLWEIVPFLKSAERSGPSALLLEQPPAPNYKASWLAKKHAQFGWGFVPLVSVELDLWCSLEVLFLRPGKPGGIYHQGDIDGRLKTLLDALAIPDANQGYASREAPKRPLFVLMENDRLVSKVSVETDELLERGPDVSDVNFARLVITVSIRPNEMHLGNMQFG